MKCTRYGWGLYFTATILPATIFCIIFIAFHIDVTSPAISYVILHCQIFTKYFHQQPTVLFTRFKYARLLFVTMIGFWNLEFFREFIPSFCASSTMTTNAVVALEYTTALYPLFLVAVTYFVIELHASGWRLVVLLWKPLHPLCVRFRRSWNIRGSVINAFTAFLCLAYSKIMSTSFHLLYQAKIDSNCEVVDKNAMRSFLNASISSKASSLPYFYVTIIISAIFCVFPLVFLVFHRTWPCRKCLGRFKVGQLFHEMAKIYEQHYKDGTGNTRDLRWFSGLYFFLRIALTASTVFIQTSYLVIVLYVMFAVTLLVAIARPYKHERYNNLDTMWFALLTIVIFCGWHALYFKYDLVILLHVLIGVSLPLVYFVLLILYKLAASIMRYCLARGWIRCFREKSNSIMNSDQLPDRLMNSSEYTPLLSTAQ